MAAPAPTCPANQVISLFSGAYSNVNVDTWLTPWSAATGGNVVQIAGNDTRLYNNVDFLGIETTGANRINATGMTNFHIDIWTPNMTTFRVKLVDFGANGIFQAGDDTEGEIAFTPIQSGWNSYVIPLADFQAVGLANRANIAQIIFSGIPVGQGTLYVDNVYFSSCQVTVPTVSTTFCVDYTCVAQTPGFAAQQINFAGGAFNGFRPLTRVGTTNTWCGTFDIPVGEVVRYSFYYAGQAGLVGDESITGSGTCFSQGTGGLRRTYAAVAGNPVTLTFAWGSCSAMPNCGPPVPTAPTVAAPAPNCLQDNVISLFSDSYNNVPVDTWLTPWSAATGGNVVPIAGNNTRLYNNVNFLGIETTGANRINATTMANFNIDVWTPNMTTFRVKLVDFGANGVFGGGDDREGEIAFTPVQGGWNTYVIPLANFQAAGLTTRANIAQIIFSGIPVGQGTLYVDNIFFSRANCTCPSGWSNANVGAANGSAIISSNCLGLNGAFSLNSTGSSTPSSDVLHAAYKEICGNTTITARVTNVSGGGWGGVMIRESLAPGSKKVSLKTQLSSIVIREIRSTTNGPSSLLNFNRPTHLWLRLVRSGSTLTGYTSVNGSNWIFAFVANISMNACVYVGVFAESINVNTTTNATFDNVTISGGSAPSLSTSPDVNPVGSHLTLGQPDLALSIDVFPNPTSGEVTVDFTPWAGQPALLEVYDLQGRRVQRLKVDEATGPMPVDMSQLPNGVYLFRVGEVQQRVVLQR